MLLIRVNKVESLRPRVMVKSPMSLELLAFREGSFFPFLLLEILVLFCLLIFLCYKQKKFFFINLPFSRSDRVTLLAKGVLV